MSTEQTSADFIISLPSVPVGCLPLSTADTAVIQVLCMTDVMEIPEEYECYLQFLPKK